MNLIDKVESIRSILRVSGVCLLNDIVCQATVESLDMLIWLNPNEKISSNFKRGRVKKVSELHENL